MGRTTSIAVLLALAGCTNPAGTTTMAAPAATCGDGICALADGEQCELCPQDCGPCDACGDGRCSVDAEDCASCPEDCGACDSCGDGICAPDSETCESCPRDCGACGVCGDGTCAAGVESCEDCPEDCGACEICGNGSCVQAAGEDCSSCAEDCSGCAGCGDGLCDGASAEDCASCSLDCGACDPCGDGTCTAADGEDCTSCAEDCGACEVCGDGECDPETETCTSCTADCGACPPRSGCIQGDFHAYFGNLHAHTSYSDGQATPGQAFAHARGAGLDFMWITDHREQLTSAEWSACRNQADTANASGSFVAGCGYEMCIFSTAGTKLGHLNLLFTGALIAKPVGLPALYAALAECSPCAGQWNHPPWPGTFRDYAHHASGDGAMRLMELSGGGAWDDKWAAYFGALQKGWLASPTSNEDNHSRNWGDSHRATGLWATELSRTALRQAVRQRRTFAAFDDTATIKLIADDVCFMGSVLHGLGRTELKVVARDRQANDGFRRIMLFGPDGGELASRACNGDNPCTATFSRRVDAATFFVALAMQSDGDQLVSAPIWFEP
ncbi:MAG: hypothetical protein ABIJ09_17035 [Pseudomonadota bacterium]